MSQTATVRLPWRRILAPRPHQVAALPAIGAVIGLLIALPGLLQGTAPRRAQVPAGDIALVNQQPILLSDYMMQIESETSEPYDEVEPARRAQVLHHMVDEELMVQRSLALDLPENDTDVREALVNGVETQVDAPVLAEPVSDAALIAFYNVHRADYATDGTMRIRNLVLHVGGYQNADQSVAQAMQDATEAAYQLRAGAPIAAVMEHFGFVDAPQEDAADQFDFAARQHLGAALFGLAETLNSGDVSDPVEQPDGVHLLAMLGRQPPHVMDFAHVRAAVYAAYRKARQLRAQAANLVFLRQSAQIVLAPGAAE